MKTSVLSLSLKLVFKRAILVRLNYRDNGLGLIWFWLNAVYCTYINIIYEKIKQLLNFTTNVKTVKDDTKMLPFSQTSKIFIGEMVFGIIVCILNKKMSCKFLQLIPSPSKCWSFGTLMFIKNFSCTHMFNKLTYEYLKYVNDIIYFVWILVFIMSCHKMLISLITGGARQKITTV